MAILETKQRVCTLLLQTMGDIVKHLGLGMGMGIERFQINVYILVQARCGAGCDGWIVTLGLFSLDLISTGSPGSRNK